METQKLLGRAGSIAVKFSVCGEGFTLGESATAGVVVAAIESAELTDEQLEKTGLSSLWQGPVEQRHIDEAILIGRVSETDSFRTLMNKMKEESING